jgi:hypothetical protein
MAVDDEFGCDDCADDQNRFFGHVEQIASSEVTGSLLLRCPRCASLYEMPGGTTKTTRLTADEARERFPGVL